MRTAFYSFENIDINRNYSHNVSVCVNEEGKNISDKLLFYFHQELEMLPKIAHQEFKVEKQISDKVIISYSPKIYPTLRIFKDILNLLRKSKLLGRIRNKHRSLSKPA